MIYKFVSHDVPARPKDDVFDLYEKAAKGEKLTRQEKDRVARACYGLFGQHSSTYKRGGYAAPFWEVLPRILVKLKYYGWQEYHAPDKTSLRKALSGTCIIREMIMA